MYTVYLFTDTIMNNKYYSDMHSALTTKVMHAHTVHTAVPLTIQCAVSSNSDSVHIDIIPCIVSSYSDSVHNVTI